MLNYTGFGLQTQQQNVTADGVSNATFRSFYNNGYTRTRLRIDSSLPTYGATTNFQSKEFSNFAYLGALDHLSNQFYPGSPNPVLMLPFSFRYSNPDNIPSMSGYNNIGLLGQQLGMGGGMTSGFPQQFGPFGMPMANPQFLPPTQLGFRF